MLRTRLWMGTLLVALAVLILMEHTWFRPWYPFLFVCYLAATVFAARELVNLIPDPVRPDPGLTLAFVAVLAVFSWWPAVVQSGGDPIGLDTWDLIVAGVAGGTVAALLREIARFRGP